MVGAAHPHGRLYRQTLLATRMLLLGLQAWLLCMVLPTALMAALMLQVELQAYLLRLSL